MPASTKEAIIDRHGVRNSTHPISCSTVHKGRIIPGACCETQLRDLRRSGRIVISGTRTILLIAFFLSNQAKSREYQQ